MSKKRENVKLTPVDVGLNQGLNELTKNSERITPRMLGHYIDHERLREEVENLEQRASHYEKQEDQIRYIVEGVARFVRNGYAFNDKGRRLIRVSDLEYRAGREYDGPIRTARVASAAMSEDPDAAKSMPEVEDAVLDTRRAAMAHKLADIGYAEGTISEGEHYRLKKGAEQRYRDNATQYKEALGKYLGRKQKLRIAAAIIFGMVGLALIFMAGPPRIVGNVIGVADPVNAIFLLGAFLVVVAILLMRRPREKIII